MSAGASGTLAFHLTLAFSYAKIFPSPYEGEGCPLGQGEVFAGASGTLAFHLTLAFNFAKIFPSPYEGEGCPIGQGEVLSAGASGIQNQPSSRHLNTLTTRKSKRCMNDLQRFHAFFLRDNTANLNFRSRNHLDINLVLG